MSDLGVVENVLELTTEGRGSEVKSFGLPGEGRETGVESFGSVPRGSGTLVGRFGSNVKRDRSGCEVSRTAVGSLGSVPECRRTDLKEVTRERTWLGSVLNSARTSRQPGTNRAEPRVGPQGVGAPWSGVEVLDDTGSGAMLGVRGFRGIGPHGFQHAAD